MKSEITTKGDNEAIMKMPILEAEDVSNSVLWALAAPAHVQIHEITIKPVGETF